VIKYFEFVNIFIYESYILLKIDIEALKYGYQIGLETLVVHTINYEYCYNNINILPGQYSRKVET